MLDAVTTLLFEDLTLLLGAELVALLCVLGIHRRRFTAKTRRAVWITLAVCAVLTTSSVLLETRREALERTIGELAEAVEKGDVPGIAARLDETFSDRGHNKADFVASVNLALQRFDIDQAKVSQFEIDLDGKEATVVFRVVCDYRGPNLVQPGVFSRWQVGCVEREDGSKLLRIEEGKIGPGGMYDWRDARGF